MRSSRWARTTATTSTRAVRRTAALHRGWIALKDALTGDDPGSVLGACVTGEDHAVSEYEKALQRDLSAGFREVVTRQHAGIVAARDEVKAMQSVS